MYYCCFLSQTLQGQGVRLVDKGVSITLILFTLFSWQQEYRLSIVFLIKDVLKTCVQICCDILCVDMLWYTWPLQCQCHMTVYLPYSAILSAIPHPYRLSFSVYTFFVISIAYVCNLNCKNLSLLVLAMPLLA